MLNNGIKEEGKYKSWIIAMVCWISANLSNWCQAHIHVQAHRNHSINFSSSYDNLLPIKST